MKLTDREINLIEAYLKLAAKDGVANITLEKIASSAKVSYGKAHLYFGGPHETMLRGVIQHIGRGAQQYAEQYLAKNKSCGMRVVDYINISFYWAKERPHHASFWLYYYYLCSIKGEYKKNHPGYLEVARQRIVDLIHQDVGAGEIRPVKDAQKAAEFMHGLLLGNLVLWTTDKRIDGFDFYKDQVISGAQLLLGYR